MNKIGETPSLWSTKYILTSDEEWVVIKSFKDKWHVIPIDEQRKILEKKKEYFWEYIPETELIETGDDNYIIKQQFIKWKTLAQTKISSLSAETLEKLLDLIDKYLLYYKEQWWDMDVMWYQYYQWNPGSIIKKIINFLKITQNFLTSTNIMISDDWKVYMVDVCESSYVRLQSRIKNFCAKPFIKMTISRLENVLQKRIDFEEENNIGRDLMQILNK